MKPPVFYEGDVVYSAGTCSALGDAAHRGDVNFNAFSRGQYPGQPLPRNALPGLRTVGLRNATDAQHWGTGWHRNEGIEVMFLLHGREVYETSTELWNLEAGDLVVCPPWRLHQVGNPHIAVGTILWFIIDTHVRRNNQSAKLPSWIILSEEDKTKLLSLVFHSSSLVFHLPEKYVHTWKKLHRILLSNAAECPVSDLAITINELLNDLLKFQNQSAPCKVDSIKDRVPAKVIVQLFLDELRTKPTQLELPWSLKEMAKICRMSPSHFTECCRQLTSLSPVHALNQMRVRRAETLLRNEPNKSITEIAMECGFTTSQYFATIFKKWNGKTPTEFRNDTAQTDNLTTHSRLDHK